MIDMKNVNLNLLRFFLVTAESKSLVKAGEKLGYSHCTVSTNISKLEKQLGVKLFTRSPLKLTDVGEDIYKTVKSGFTDIDFAGVIANSKNDMEQGKISIGCPSHILDFYLMPKIAKVVKDYPNFKINLDTSYECEDLIVALKQNEIDFAILDRIPDEYDKEDLEIKEVNKSEYIFIADKEIVINDINDLNKYKYILSGTQRGNTIKLVEILKRYNIELDVVLRCGLTEQRINAAKEGIGIAYVLKEATKKAIDNKEVYEVKLPNSIKLPKVSLDLVYLKNHLTKVDRKFINTYLLEKDSN